MISNWQQRHLDSTERFTVQMVVVLCHMAGAEEFLPLEAAGAFTKDENGFYPKSEVEAYLDWKFGVS